MAKDETIITKIKVEDGARKNNFWREEELIKLTEGVVEYGLDWKQVSRHVGTRTKTQC